MARRTKDEAEQTRDAILDSAEEVFFHRGVSRTSLQEIAVAAGVTRGAVYWHFRDKPELVVSMVNRVTLPQEDILEQLAKGAETSRSPLEDLRRACVDGFAHMMKDKRRRRVFTILTQRCEFTDDIAPCMERRRECAERMRERFVRLLERAHKLGQLAAPWTPPIAARALQAIMTGLLVRGLETDAPRKMAEDSKACLESFFRTLRAGKSS